MSLTGSFALRPKPDDQMTNYESPDRESLSDLMACAIPVDGAAAITAAAAGFIHDDEIPQFSPKWDSQSPESATASEASDFFQVARDGRKNMQDHDDCAIETLETHPDASERMYENDESDRISVEYATPLSSRAWVMEHLGSSESFFRW